jgi:phenylalanyl-tRNA synthetase beta subunit
VIDVANQNKANNLQLFEIANVYLKKNKGLPDEVLHLAVVVRKEKASFFDGKGIVESVAKILGITTISFEKKKDGIEGADIMLSGKNIGSIEADEDITVEINVQELLKHANSKKIYKEPAKFPPLIEDVRVEIPAHYPFAKIEKALKESSELVHSISLLDVYKNKKTFRIVYLSRTRSLTTGDIQPIRKGIEDILTTQFKATLG